MFISVNDVNDGGMISVTDTSYCRPSLSVRMPLVALAWRAMMGAVRFATNCMRALTWGSSPCGVEFMEYTVPVLFPGTVLDLCT